MRNCEGEVSVAGVGWRAVGIKSGTMRDCRNLLNIMSASERVDFLRQLVYGLFISSEEWSLCWWGK